MKPDKLLGILKPNALIGRTVWSSPQGGLSCHLCKYWAPDNPEGINVYDPTVQESWFQLVNGKCSNLRVMAAYGKVPTVRSFFYCTLYEEKEKEDGETMRP